MEEHDDEYADEQAEFETEVSLSSLISQQPAKAQEQVEDFDEDLQINENFDNANFGQHMNQQDQQQIAPEAQVRSPFLLIPSSLPCSTNCLTNSTMMPTKRTKTSRNPRDRRARSSEKRKGK